MQVAQDRARPSRFHCECKGLALRDACKYIAGARNTSGCPPPPPPPEKYRRKRRRRRVIIGTPGISCSRYTSKNYKPLAW